MAINSVCLVGNTTREVEVRRTQSGTPVCNFSLAVNERKKDTRTGEWVDEPNFFDVVCFGERYEKLAQYIHKGTKLMVQGKLRQSRWESDGQKRSKVEVIAQEIELPPKQRQAEYVEAEVYDNDCPF